jgi:hypothetical protein
VRWLELPCPSKGVELQAVQVKIDGAAWIHGERRKLGIDVGQTSVAKYMARRRGPPSPGVEDVCADGVAAMDPVRGADDLAPIYVGLLILRHARRRLTTSWCLENGTFVTRSFRI